MSPAQEKASIRESFEDVRSNVEHLTEELRQRANEMAEEFGDRANRYYNEAQDWMSNNRGRLLTVVGVLAAVGIAGFLIARQTQRRQIRLSERERAA